MHKVEYLLFIFYNVEIYNKNMKYNIDIFVYNSNISYLHLLIRRDNIALRREVFL